MLDFVGKLILAPMVRVSTLPVRLLSLQYGADIVFSEEIVDHKLLAAVRQYNNRLNTIDYVDPADGIVVFRTCAEERDRVVLQIGTSDPVRAARVAKKVQNDVAAIDVNMGCPKEFSIKGGMGAALLTEPDKVCQILRAMVEAVDIPITCKVRVLCEPAEPANGCPARQTKIPVRHDSPPDTPPANTVPNGNNNQTPLGTACTGRPCQYSQCSDEVGGGDQSDGAANSSTFPISPPPAAVPQLVPVAATVACDSERLPAVSERLPAVSERLPAVSERLPAVSERLPAVSERLPVPSERLTVAFCRMVASCGVAAVTVHGRTRHQRPRHANNNDVIASVARALTIPVIANGGSRHISCRHDIEQFRGNCGASGSMVARAAMWNMSVFAREGPRPLDEVIVRLLRYCIRYDHPFTLVKYTVQQMLGSLQQSPRGKRFLASQTVHDICEIWNLGRLCLETLGPSSAVMPEGGANGAVTPGSDSIAFKRPRLADDVVRGGHHYVRGQYRECSLPKTVLLNWCRQRWPGEPDTAASPRYSVELWDKLFRAVCSVQGRGYASAWEKNKKWAEQGAALTCLLELGLTHLLPPIFCTLSSPLYPSSDTSAPLLPSITSPTPPEVNEPPLTVCASSDTSHCHSQM